MVDYVLSAATTQGPGPTTTVTSPTSTEASPRELPPVVRELLDAPTPKPHGWATTLAPAFLGVVVWFPLLDGFGQAGASSTILVRWTTACITLLIGYALIYRPLAGLGLRERKRLPVVAAGALGADGAEWLAGVLYGLFAAVWGSVAIGYSVRMTLDGLVAWGLLEPVAARPEGPLVLTALAFWTFIIVSAVGVNLTGAIVAMMKIYWPFAGLLLAGAAGWAVWRGVPWGGRTAGGTLLDLHLFQYVFSALAFPLLMAVEWGGAVRDRRDVRMGGLVGFLGSGAVAFLAASILAAIGAGGSIRAALTSQTFGPWAGGGLLLLFGLASLAPAVYAADLLRSRFRRHWPALGNPDSALLGFLILFIPGALGLAHRIETIAEVSGAFFAPLAGLLVAESRRQPTSIRPGWSTSGLVAWGVGVLFGLSPILAQTVGNAWPASFPPASFLGASASVMLYQLLSPPAKAQP
ncbi:hypothetical protein [Paludisphaera rhizosphaerae]|uniref:hypothetical protein n=1 Tax=Paludisphaera rhizosphaerae TaxID=2711216 RepID=UPI0013ED42C3|nr:hypothetical protein [Paludisphaera rhizosphaerae]